MKNLLLAAAAATFFVPAHAFEILSVDYVNGREMLWVTTTDSPAYTEQMVGAGALTINNDSFVSYCVELTQYLSNLPAEFIATDLGPKHSDLELAVQWMVDLDTFNPNDSTESALNQAIIWEIVYEDSGSYGFDSGDFQIRNTAIASANTLTFDFSQLSNVTPSVTIARLHNELNQDQLIVVEIPEPSTYALMLAGLCGMGLWARKRQPR